MTPVFNPPPVSKIYSVLDYSSTPLTDYTGATNCSNAVTLAQQAIKSNGGGTLLFPTGGNYLINTGIITRTNLADCYYAITFTGAILKFTGTGIGILTQFLGTDYWSSRITPSPAPIVGDVVDCTNLTSGAIGVLHSNAIGGYYDFLIWHANATPDITWPTSGNDGARGMQLLNTLISGSVPKYTEQVTFGPNFGTHDCYIGLEIDAYNGTSSFEFTTMLRHNFEVNVTGQRGIVIRGSNGGRASIAGYQMLWSGNQNSNPISIGTFTDTLVSGTSGVVSLGFSGGTTTAVYDGQIILLTNGTNNQAVMVRGNNPVGSTSVLVYQFTSNYTFTGGSVSLVSAICVIGWPGITATGWSSGTATDASSLSKGSLNWMVDSNSYNVKGVTLFISPTSVFYGFGNIDFVTNTGNIIQNYGSYTALGNQQGHVNASLPFSTLWLGSGNSVNGVQSCLGETTPKWALNNNTSLTLTTQQPIIAAIAVQPGVPITGIGWYSGTTGSTTMTNQWMALLDSNFNQVAISADQTTTNIVAKTFYSYPIATISSGSATSYTPISPLLYVALCVSATSPPQVTGLLPVSTALLSRSNGGFYLAGATSNSFTTPPAFPQLYTRSGNPTVLPYFWVYGNA